MNKYDLLKQIGEICDQAEKTAAENEALKKEISRIDPETGDVDPQAIRLQYLNTKFAHEILRADYAMIEDGLKEGDSYFDSKFISNWSSSYPKACKNMKFEVWLNKISRNSVFINKILDYFQMSDLIALFKPHLALVFDYLMKQIEVSSEEKQ